MEVFNKDASENVVVFKYILLCFQLTVKDRDKSALCLAVGDPHFTTFDKK